MLSGQLIATHNGKSPWLTKAFGRRVSEMEHRDVVLYGMFPAEICDMHPQEWTKQALQTSEDAVELCLVEVIPESHF